MPFREHSSFPLSIHNLKFLLTILLYVEGLYVLDSTTLEENTTWAIPKPKLPVLGLHLCLVERKINYTLT